MKRRTWSSLAAAIILLLMSTGLPATAQEVTGSLSNFDVRNVDERRYDDFELMLFGEIDRECIRGFYPGWGGPPKVRPETPFGPGVTIVWRDARDPIGPGRTEHFGVRLDCDGPITARGFWSLRGEPVREVPLPWQIWRAEGGAVWDVVRLPRELSDEIMERGVVIERQWVTLPEPIELEQLNWKEVEYLVRRMERRWKSLDPERLGPGDKAVLEIPTTSRDRAAVVRYTVRSGRQVVSRFVNQAILGWKLLCPANLPNPQIQITGTEDYEAGGNAWTRYRISVTNRAAYPDSLFDAAPDLPPCGTNTSASRTWVDLHDGNGDRLYGFCALGEADDLGQIWFAMPRGTPPPECVSVTLTDRRCEETYTSSCAPTTGHGPACIDFESPAPGTTWGVPSTFTDSGATMTVEPFQWSNGNWTSAGQAAIGTAGQAGGSGQELNANNVNVDVAFPATPNVVHLKFGEYGGNLNLEVNGDFRNFADFADLHGAVVGGTTLSVTNGLGNDQGTLLLSGEIHSFALGGQELWVDDVCYAEQPDPVISGTWVMPYAVGGTPLYRIDPNGFTDYTDGGLVMNDAPFGGRLGFRLGRANAIPTSDVYYYRLQYKHQMDAGFTDFSESVSVHYQVEHATNPPKFPTLELGPNNVNGRKLYRFRPHESELPSLIPPLAPGETVSWPDTGWIGDIYRGFLNTGSLAPGRYTIRLEIYNQAGVRVTQAGGTFRFVEPVSHATDGTLISANVADGDLVDHGYEFPLQVDNREVGAQIDEPKIGTDGAGDCGFLRYDPSTTGDVTMSFWATHPANHAVFSFRIARGPQTVTNSVVSGADVTVPAAPPPGGPYTGDGFGHFTRDFTFAELLGKCQDEAAFAAVLHVYAKATRGWGHRIGSLDESHVYAFALTPQTP